MIIDSTIFVLKYIYKTVKLSINMSKSSTINHQSQYYTIIDSHDY